MLGLVNEPLAPIEPVSSLYVPVADVENTTTSDLYLQLHRGASDDPCHYWSRGRERPLP
jgi:hypothetical protein